MNSQEIFDKIATHLFTQGEQSAKKIGACLYRGPNGTSCAVGCLIPDEEYLLDMENKTVYGLLDFLKNFCRTAPITLDILTGHYGLLYDLQIVHDKDASWLNDTNMIAALTAVAHANGLNTSILARLSFNR